MSDAPVIYFGESSPEAVAFKLYDKVELAESHPKRTRQQILALYSECLLAVRNPRGHVGESQQNLPQYR